MGITVDRRGYDTAIIEWDNPGIVKLYKQYNEADDPILLVESDYGIYVDNDPTLSKDNPLYYVESGDYVSPKTRINGVGDNYQYYIVDSYNWQLKNLGRGYAATAYIKKNNVSEHCPECYNETLKKVTKSICNTCDGTGMMGSLKGPVSFYMGITRTSKEKVYEEIKEREEETINAWTSNVPYLKQGDIVLFSGVLYVVQYIPNYVYSPSQNDNRPFIMKQDFVLVRLDRNNQLYSKLSIK